MASMHLYFTQDGQHVTVPEFGFSGSPTDILPHLQHYAHGVVLYLHGLDDGGPDCGVLIKGELHRPCSVLKTIPREPRRRRDTRREV